MFLTGNFSNGATRDITGFVLSPSTTSFASVTKPGGNLAWLTALAVTPLTTITTTYGSLTATTNLTVVAPTLNTSVNTNGLQLTSASTDLTVGVSSRFKLTATFIDGTTQDVTANSVWSSTGGVTVGDAGLDKGRVKGETAGSASVSATFGNQTVTIPVTVKQRTLSSLTIFPLPITVNIGNKATIATTATYSDNTSVSVTDDTVWSIDKPFVAILADSTNQPGQVVGVDQGTATLTATFGGKIQTTTITVP
jgi:hypothetical protein